MVRHAIAALCVGVWALYRFTPQPALPPGTAVSGLPRAVPPGGVRVLVDSTAWDAAGGRRVLRQEIADEALRMIGEADAFVVADFFLWNDWQGPEPETHRALARELADALRAARARRPGLPVLVLTDPINRLYGGAAPAFFDDMAAAGVRVVFTDLFRMRDSNLVLGPPARFLGAAGRWAWTAGFLDRPRFANPFTPSGPPLGLRQYARLLQFKANHRKVLVTGRSDGSIRALATSFNPADGSSAHSNVGIIVDGGAAADALESELKVIEWSLAGPYGLPGRPAHEARADLEAVKAKAALLPRTAASAGPRARWLTEGGIRAGLLELLGSAEKGDELRVAMFYLSDRAVLGSLGRAAARGAGVRMILDPNRDAFGRKKNGVPNRPVAASLAGNIAVRWADTHGEQFHVKAVSLRRADGRCALLAGSANWTRRNLQDLNLEADVLLEDCPEACGTFDAWFDRAWGNSDGRSHVTDSVSPPDRALGLRLRGLLGAFQEWSGAGTF